MQSETRNCQNCKNDFVIDSEDFNFYTKINVPPPTFCPSCRRQRRNAWRNNFSLYSRKCDLCSKNVISIYSPDSGIIVYCNKCWWSDKWDPKSYVMDYDFWMRIYRKWRPGIINEKLSAFRIHGQSKGGAQFEKQFAEEFEVVKKYQKNGLILFLHKIHNMLINWVYRRIK